MPVNTTQLIPLDELTPGAVGAIRNTVIEAIVAKASKELNIPSEQLVVRDVRPATDLQLYAAGTTDSTVDEWGYDATTTSASAFTPVNGSKTMGNQRYVALFGVRDLRKGIGVHTTAMSLFEATTLMGDATSASVPIVPGQMVSLIKINVGGADKVIWDLTGMEAYDNPVAFTPSAVIIPQNSTFNIYYYFKTTCAGIRAYLQLVGVVVEPRGKVVSP